MSANKKNIEKRVANPKKAVEKTPEKTVVKKVVKSSVAPKTISKAASTKPLSSEFTPHVRVQTAEGKKRSMLRSRVASKTGRK